MVYIINDNFIPDDVVDDEDWSPHWFVFGFVCGILFVVIIDPSTPRRIILSKLFPAIKNFKKNFCHLSFI